MASLFRAWYSRPVLPVTLVHVEYQVPGKCPGQADFQAGVRARTARAVFTDEASAREIVHVTVRVTGSTYAGHLSISGRDRAEREGTMKSRDVDDVLCADVVDALSLVTALALDPDAVLAPTERARPFAGPAEALPPPKTAEAPEMPPRVSPPAASTVVPDEVFRVSPDRESARRSRQDLPRVLHVNAGAAFELAGDIAPDAMLGGGVFTELDTGGGGAFRPSARVTIAAASNGAAASRSATFFLVDARIDACPVRLAARKLSVRPCTAFEAGDLAARGVDVASPVTAWRPWAAVDGFVRARYAPFRALDAAGEADPAHGVTPGFFVDLEAGFAVPLTRPRYVYDLPQVDVHRAPVAVPTGAFGIGFRFW